MNENVEMDFMELPLNKEVEISDNFSKDLMLLGVEFREDDSIYYDVEEK